MQINNSLHRNFEGVWIPKDIWLDNNLTIMQKCMFVEIKSLDNEDNEYKGCFATNRYFAEFFGISVVQVSNHISKLKSKKYIKEVSFDGKVRVLKCCVQMEITLKETLKTPLKKPLIPPQRNLEVPYKNNSTVNNTTSKADLIEKYKQNFSYLNLKLEWYDFEVYNRDQRKKPIKSLERTWLNWLKQAEKFRQQSPAVVQHKEMELEQEKLERTRIEYDTNKATPDGARAKIAEGKKMLVAKMKI